MNKKVLFLFLGIFILITSLEAQVGTFRLNYNFSLMDITGNMIQDDDNNFIIVGTNVQFVPYGNISKLDINGNIIWSKGVSAAFGTTLNDVIEVSPGLGDGYLAVGSADSRALLVKTDNNGDLDWSQRYEMPDIPSGDASSVNANAAIETSDGNFLIAGSVTHFWDGVSATTNDTTHCFAIKVDQNGGIIWDRTFVVIVPDEDEHYLLDVTETADGYVFGGASSRGDGTLNDDGDYPRDGIIIKTDFNGNLVYSNVFGGETRSEYVNSTETLSTGDVLLGGERGRYGYVMRINGVGGSPSIAMGRRYHIDGDIWSFTIDEPIMVSKAFEAADGNYITLGTHLNPNNFNEINTTLTKVNNSNGSVIFAQSYDNFFASLLPKGGLASDDGFFMFSTDGTTSWNYLAIKTDENGLLNNPSNCPDATYDPDDSSYNPTLNPITPVVHPNLAIAVSSSPTLVDLSPDLIEDCRIVVCDEPVAPTVTADPEEICEGGSSTLTASGSGSDITYHFYTDATGGTAFDSGNSTTVSPTETTTYYVEAEDDNNPGCVSDRTPITVVVNEAPEINAAVNPSPVCVGSDIELTESNGYPSYSWSGPDGFSSTDQNPTITDAQQTNGGTYTIEVEDANGCSDSTTIEVEVVDLPEPTASSNSPVCVDGTIELEATGGTDYSWTGPDGFTSGDQNPTIPNATQNNEGTYEVTVVDGNNCENTATVTVTIHDLPTAEASSNSPICEGQDLELNASGGTGYTWTGPNGFTSDDQNPIITGTTQDDQGTYEVLVEDDNGCENTATVDVIISAGPTATASVDSPVCEGDNIELTADGGTSYEWEGPDNYDSNSQNPIITDVTPDNQGDYTVTVTDDDGCSNTATVTVIVNDAPEITTTSNSPICEGDDLTFSASGGNEYEWIGPNGFTSTDASNTIENATSANGGDYTVTVEDANGCTSSETIPIEILDPPTAGIDGEDEICEGEEVTLTATGNGDYLWNTGETTQQITVSPTADETFSVTVTAGSCSDEAFIDITVNPSPTADITEDQEVCAGDEVTLTATGGDSYSWSNGENGSSITVSPSTDTEYTVTVSLDNGCSDEATVNVEVLPLPNGEISGVNSICVGESTTLTASGGVGYGWGTGETTEDITVSPTETTTYTVEITGANGCPIEVSETVEVNVQPDAEIVGSTTMCTNEAYTLIATGGMTYEWSTGETGDQIDVTVDEDTQFWVVASNGACSDTAYIDVEANEAPGADISGETFITQLETSILTAGPDDAASYSWSPGEGLSCTDCQTTEANPYVTTEYCVTVVDQQGCADTACVEVEVDFICGEIFVPNAFSPNNDGENDCFQVHGNCIAEMSLQVFSRWGELVFETSHQDNCWDGTHNGKDLNTGVFAYVLNVVNEQGETIKMKGNVSLIK